MIKNLRHGADSDSMWMRGVLTLVWILLVGVAFILWDCSAAMVGDPLVLCPNVARMGLPEPLWVAWGFLAVSLVGLLTAWSPSLEDRHRQKIAHPELLLIANIGRLPDPYRHDGAGGPADPVTDLKSRVELVETALSTDATPTRAMTAEWLRLLLEANHLHNEGTLPTREFMDLNTRLLEVVAAPSSATSR